MKKNNKGFTLAELLIVVAIIAVLVAIAIPIFTAQLERSREATDLANVRSAYAEVVSSYLTDNKAHSTDVTLKSNTADVLTDNTMKVANVAVTDILQTSPTKVAIDANGNATINDKPAGTDYTVS